MRKLNFEIDDETNRMMNVWKAHRLIEKGEDMSVREIVTEALKRMCNEEEKKEVKAKIDKTAKVEKAAKVEVVVDEDPLGLETPPAEEKKESGLEEAKARARAVAMEAAAKAKVPVKPASEVMRATSISTGVKARAKPSQYDQEAPVDVDQGEAT